MLKGIKRIAAIVILINLIIPIFTTINYAQDAALADAELIVVESEVVYEQPDSDDVAESEPDITESPTDAATEYAPEPTPQGEPDDATQPPAYVTEAPAPTGVHVTDAPRVTTAPTAAPTPVPTVIAYMWQEFTDHKSVWMDEQVLYTIRAGLLNENSVIAVYDAAHTLDYRNPVILAYSTTYPVADIYQQEKQLIFWNPEFDPTAEQPGAWQFVYTPDQPGRVQLAWRVYYDMEYGYYIDYPNDQTPVSEYVEVYAPPSVQLRSAPSGVAAGDPVTLTYVTPTSVYALSLTDANGDALPYVDSITSRDNGSLREWTCVVRFYQPGSYGIKALASAELEGVAKSVYSAVTNVGIIPSNTPVATPDGGVTPDPYSTDDPEPTPYIIDTTQGYVRFKQVPSANARIGESITLNLDVEFAAYDGRRINYTEPDFYNYVDYIEVQPEITLDGYPFVINDSLQRIIIHSYDEMLETPFRFNVRVKSGLSNGAYSFNFTLRYRLKGNEEPEADKTETGMVFVTGASSGGSGGGGGGGGVSLPDPQAKLIIESVRTEPADPKAGDKFDVIMTITNTSESQYVQNLKVSYTADNDVLLPTNGSSTFYIDRINAGESYELTAPVQARADMPDAPVKLNVNIDYEDKNVSSQSASQTMVLNVSQVQKLKLDELVPPQRDITVGQSAAFKMNIINSGRTTLYNVSAAMLESEMYATAGSAYVGNMEAGSSKSVELTIYPLAEGSVDGTLRVTYEDANGNASSEDVPFSIYAMAEEVYDPYEYYEPVIEPTPEPTIELQNVVARLPWWVYGAAGGLVICLVVLLATAVHRKRVFSYDDYDDE